MRNSLRQTIVDGTIDFDKTPKQEWVFGWPQQTILVLDQIQWTENVEKAIKEQTRDALVKAHQAEESKL